MKLTVFIILLAVGLIVGAPGSAQTGDISSTRQRAEAGDGKAQFDLAQAYWEGTGVPKDPVKGLEWLKKSATQGFAGAQVTLGVFYQNGVQVAKDPHEAASWFRKAARQSATDPKHAQRAQSDLGILATEGLISVEESDWRTLQPGEQPPAPPSPKPAASADTTVNSSPNSSATNHKPAPFSLSEVETGLTGGITTKRMATLISQYGVDFSLGPVSKQRLADDGADESLLGVIASSKR
jgi:Sel1 repeat